MEGTWVLSDEDAERVLRFLEAGPPEEHEVPCYDRQGACVECNQRSRCPEVHT